MDLREILRRGFDEYVDHVNPFVAQRAELAGEPIRVVRAEDGRLFDADGRAIEDFHGTQMFGHRHPAITAAVKAFLETDAPNWYPSRVSPQAGRARGAAIPVTAFVSGRWLKRSTKRRADEVAALRRLADGRDFLKDPVGYLANAA